MTDENEKRLAEVRERLEKASPAPWSVGRYDDGGKGWRPNVWHSGHGAPVCYLDRPGAPEKDAADAQLIANAPADLAWALERIEELRADAKRLDWMEQHGASVEVGDSEDLPCEVQSSTDFESHAKGSAFSLREVIDAAMYPECPGCSEAGGADRAVHHAPPLCKSSRSQGAVEETENALPLSSTARKEDA